jgi:hypothetical protein
MRPLLFVVALASFATLHLHADPVALLNGKDLTGWDYFTPDKTATIAQVCQVKPNGVVAVAGKPNGYLQLPGAYENYHLHAEWRWSGQPGNGGILLHISSGPKEKDTWPINLQVQLKNKAVGDLIPMVGASFIEPLTTAPGAATPLRAKQAADSEKPVGEWNACDVTCLNGTIEVTVNGVLQNKVSGCQPASGKIGFQLEGIPYELRNVSVETIK